MIEKNGRVVPRIIGDVDSNFLEDGGFIACRLRPCWICEGSGRGNGEPCKDCDGAGYVLDLNTAIPCIASLVVTNLGD